QGSGAVLLFGPLLAVVDVVRAADQAVQRDVELGHDGIQRPHRRIGLARLQLGDEAGRHAQSAGQLPLADARLDPLLPQSLADALEAVAWGSHRASIDRRAATVSSRTDRARKKPRSRRQTIEGRV